MILKYLHFYLNITLIFNNFKNSLKHNYAQPNYSRNNNSFKNLEPQAMLYLRQEVSVVVSDWSDNFAFPFKIVHVYGSDHTSYSQSCGPPSDHLPTSLLSHSFSLSLPLLFNLKIKPESIQQLHSLHFNRSRLQSLSIHLRRFSRPLSAGNSHNFRSPIQCSWKQLSYSSSGNLTSMCSLTLYLVFIIGLHLFLLILFNRLWVER